MENLTPNVFVKDIGKTIDFYKELGFTVTMNVPEQPPFVWVNMACGGVSMMFQSWESLGKDDVPAISRTDTSGPMLLYISLKNIRQLFDRLQGKAEILTPLEKTFYGATEFSIKDINGLVLTFAEHEGQ